MIPLSRLVASRRDTFFAILISLSFPFAHLAKINFHVGGISLSILLLTFKATAARHAFVLSVTSF